MAFLETDEIESRLALLPRPSARVGRVERVVLRLADEKRSCPGVIRLDVGSGAVGDRWAMGKSPDPLAQVTVMRADIASLFCDGGDYSLLGDNIFAHLDTSSAALPAGTRLRIGTALCEVTPKPHTGCSKFAARVGKAAWKFTLSPERLADQLRGVHVAVLESGDVRDGDPIVVEGAA
jgi:MOSC domain-containing protein YiiM